MHSYLIISKNSKIVEKKIDEIKKRFQLFLIHYNVEKIEDVRSLKAALSLSFNKPTGVVIQNIQNATKEALNAFLKNLEEPQENVFFILTASKSYAILPTILSRCQVIHTQSHDFQSEETVGNLARKEKEELIDIVQKIKDREEAIQFSQNYIASCHEILHKEKKEALLSLSQNIASAQTLYQNLSANGNVSLQLTNFIVSLV